MTILLTKFIRSNNIHLVSETYNVLQGDYAMRTTTETMTEKAKPFLVRLPDSKIRNAYEQYCRDNLRSLDAQSSMLIIKELRSRGYLRPSDKHEDNMIRR